MHLSLLDHLCYALWVHLGKVKTLQTAKCRARWTSKGHLPIALAREILGFATWLGSAKFEGIQSIYVDIPENMVGCVHYVAASIHLDKSWIQGLGANPHDLGTEAIRFFRPNTQRSENIHERYHLMII